ncbi:FemAB family XrtA/PEP-CTERM system-associated protein [Erythrobacter sp. MTPC3]|uniref:FemAB family XrtA/PEP-CTERM system-associated protein n=1 Tax=Erythrobacter sp. MTPC3 TaxID=3056564 RepID=UPI0036F24E22
MNAPAALNTDAQLVDLGDARMAERIDTFVERKGASLFHRPAWLRAVEKGTGQRASGFVTRQYGAITGWLPLTEVRSVLFGKALVSSGFGVGGGILADTGDAIEKVACAAQAYAQDHGFSAIEVRGGSLPDHWQQWDDRHAGFERALADTDENQLQAIPRKARAEIRKSLKNDLEIRIGSAPDDLAAHYAVYSESVRNLGTPVFPKSLFEAMLAEFPDAADILTVCKEGTPVSSVFSFYHGGAVMPFWGGGTVQARSERANERMYYELMLHARRKGMKVFDFGRSKTGSGPYNFKKNWGFDPVPLVYGEWVAGGGQGRDIDPTSDAYSRKIDLWKKLPLPIANTIGPWIARGLA